VYGTWECEPGWDFDPDVQCEATSSSDTSGGSDTSSTSGGSDTSGCGIDEPTTIATITATDTGGDDAAPECDSSGTDTGVSTLSAG
jgi:hypothetical protein